MNKTDPTRPALLQTEKKFRGHDGAVLSVAWGQHECFSAGLDGNIFAWPIPKVKKK